MKDHVERMKQEHKELKANIESLSAFIHGNEIYQSLCDIEQVQMVKQLGFMESYFSVLESRIWTAK